MRYIRLIIYRLKRAGGFLAFSGADSAMIIKLKKVVWRVFNLLNAVEVKKIGLTNFSLAQ